MPIRPHCLQLGLEKRTFREALPAMSSMFNSPEPARVRPPSGLRALLCAMGLALAGGATWAADTHAADTHKAPAKKIIEEEAEAPPANPKEMANKVREALGVPIVPNKKLTLVINGKAVATAPASPW